MKIELKNTNGITIFTYIKEDNTIKETVLEAIRQGIYLRHTDLRYANLSGVDLSWVNLIYADLNGTIFNHSKSVLVPCKWGISIMINGMIRIGCEAKTITDWDNWFKGNEVYTTSRDTDEFKLIQDNYINVRDFILIKS